jgi:energy-converting hydrogenase Eha subunit C
MPRILLLSVLVLLLPTLLWLFIAFVVRKGDAETFRKTPFITLLSIGFIGMIGALAYLIEVERGGSPGQTYRPPSFEDGVLKPGRSE